MEDAVSAIKATGKFSMANRPGIASAMEIVSLIDPEHEDWWVAMSKKVKEMPPIEWLVRCASWDWDEDKTIKQNGRYGDIYLG